ncbi:MAG TPA: amino acid ABC transporter substrate-binding protein [Ureibacillus sp.]|uniref:amino acid ABC transporter substrate-binding protein n=1 Tax=Peribacillus asahii TaxID=228899 RepID=UPI00207AE72D|nr:amino acid ABC transporter substrate-binding protein [Peribacillus asahii]USK57980.1 amino acid ABC transporter substrate-binding protein [Peribacillus asahii]HWL24740.1 amino acid ABC transporter substrate-binding protein [Ureibacillus sp.]
MKKVAFILLTLLITIALGACGSNEPNSKTAESKNLYEEIKEKGEITIGTEGTYAPFTFHDESEKLTGFDIELAEEVFKRLDIKPVFVETKWDGMIAGLDAKRYDMVANEVAIRDDRLEKYDMSDPYIVSRAVLIVHKDNNDIKTLDDLNGKKVGQSLESNYRKIAEDHGATNTVVEGFNQAVDLITSKRIDATINDSLSYLDLKKQRPELPIKVVFEEADASSNGFLFRKGSTELVKAVNGALAEMKEDGTYLEISKKWFNEDVSK